MCLSDYQDVGGQVCLASDDNPYIAKAVRFLLEVDEGIRWNQNFKHFGAAHPQKITAEEILVSFNDLSTTLIKSLTLRLAPITYI